MIGLQFLTYVLPLTAIYIYIRSLIFIQFSSFKVILQTGVCWTDKAAATSFFLPRV